MPRTQRPSVADGTLVAEITSCCDIGSVANQLAGQVSRPLILVFAAARLAALAALGVDASFPGAPRSVR
jgi:hypothetical protein